jgi:hypothetical protein
LAFDPAFVVMGVVASSIDSVGGDGCIGGGVEGYGEELICKPPMVDLYLRLSTLIFFTITFFLPCKVNALKLARLYKKRKRIE